MNGGGICLFHYKKKMPDPKYKANFLKQIIAKLKLWEKFMMLNLGFYIHSSLAGKQQCVISTKLGRVKISRSAAASPLLAEL